MTECPHCGKEIVVVSVMFGKSTNKAERISGQGESKEPYEDTCKKCGEAVWKFWSKKKEYWYPTNSKDYRDFHRQTCTGSEG